MIITKFINRGPLFLKALRKHQAGNLHRACIFLVNDIKKSISTKAGPCNPAKHRTQVGTKRAGRRSESEYDRSKPGEPPHLQCGELRRSLTHEVDEQALIGRVGSNKKYAGYLERGTRYMLARPYLQPALLRNRNTIKRLITLPMK